MLGLVLGPPEVGLTPSFPAGGAESSWLAMLWPALLVVGLCAALLGGLGWLRRRSLGGQPGQLELTARFELSPQHVLYVVRTDGRRLLLGGAPGGLSLLTELNPTEAIVPTLPRSVIANEAARDKERAA
jgi:flagellar biogenesis protein FliO